VSFRCVKEGVTRIYARKFQAMLECQVMLGSGRVC